LESDEDDIQEDHAESNGDDIEEDHGAEGLVLYVEEYDLVDHVRSAFQMWGSPFLNSDIPWVIQKGALLLLI
jgi:hypothetical protein